MLGLLTLLLVLTSSCGGSIYAPGRIDGSFYNSEFPGLSFELPDGWSFFTEDEMKEVFGESDEITINEMSAHSSDNLEVIMLSVEKLTGFNRLITEVKLQMH